MAWIFTYIVSERIKSILGAATATASFLLAASFFYYICDAIKAAYNSHHVILPEGSPITPESLTVSWPEAVTLYLPEMLMWIFISIILGPIVGIAAFLAHRHDIIGILCKLTLPAGILLWSFVLLSAELEVQPRPAVVIAHVIMALAAITGVSTLFIRYMIRSHKGKTSVLSK